MLALNYIIDNSIQTVELAENYPYSYDALEQRYFGNRVKLSPKLDPTQYNLPYKIFNRVQFSNVYGTPKTPVVSLMSDNIFDGRKVMSYLARGIAVLAAMNTKATSTSSREFSAYNGKGIVKKFGCPKGGTDHQVTFIGYGIKDGERVWLIRNSWGRNWGNYGAFYVRQGNNDLCIENYAYAIIPKSYDSSMGVFNGAF